MPWYKSQLDEVIRLEVERDRMRLWTPVKRLLSWSRYDIADDIEIDEDDDPGKWNSFWCLSFFPFAYLFSWGYYLCSPCIVDVIQGVQPSTLEDLGMPRQRDPDALPPRNVFDWAMSILYYAAASCAHGNVLFALKAGIFSVALCLPSFIKSSSTFAYGKW